MKIAEIKLYTFKDTDFGQENYLKRFVQSVLDGVRNEEGYSIAVGEIQFGEKIVHSDENVRNLLKVYVHFNISEKSDSPSRSARNVNGELHEIKVGDDERFKKSLPIRTVTVRSDGTVLPIGRKDGKDIYPPSVQSLFGYSVDELKNHGLFEWYVHYLIDMYNLLASDSVCLLKDRLDGKEFEALFQKILHRIDSLRGKILFGEHALERRNMEYDRYVKYMQLENRDEHKKVIDFLEGQLE